MAVETPRATVWLRVAVRNEEIDGLALWTPAAAPEPLGATDRALLTRFAGTGLPKSV